MIIAIICFFLYLIHKWAYKGSSRERKRSILLSANQQLRERDQQEVPGGSKPFKTLTSRRLNMTTSEQSRGTVPTILT